MTHAFQPFTNDIYTTNPFKIKNEPALLTAGNKERTNTMTISWGGTGVMWGKDVGFVFVKENRYTKEFLDNFDTFSISFFAPTKENSLMLQYMGNISGRNEDKLAVAKFHVNFWNDTPYIDEAREISILKKLSVTKISPEDFIAKDIIEPFYEDGYYHCMYIGEVLQLMAR